jgi:hypothetical protein
MLADDVCARNFMVVNTNELSVMQVKTITPAIPKLTTRVVKGEVWWSERGRAKKPEPRRMFTVKEMLWKVVRR